MKPLLLTLILAISCSAYNPAFVATESESEKLTEEQVDKEVDATLDKTARAVARLEDGPDAYADYVYAALSECRERLASLKTRYDAKGEDFKACRTQLRSCNDSEKVSEGYAEGRVEFYRNALVASVVVNGLFLGWVVARRRLKLLSLFSRN